MVKLYLLLLALLTSTINLLFSPIVLVPRRYALSVFLIALLILSHAFAPLSTAAFFNAALGFFIAAAGFFKECFAFGLAAKKFFPQLWVCLHISYELACAGHFCKSLLGPAFALSTFSGVTASGVFSRRGQPLESMDLFLQFLLVWLGAPISTSQWFWQSFFCSIFQLHLFQGFVQLCHLQGCQGESIFATCALPGQSSEVAQQDRDPF